MKRFGSQHHQGKKYSQDDIFLMRLHLLVIMVKAALKGYPTGRFRKAAVLENAAAVHRLVSDISVPFFKPNTSSHLFKERVKLLSVMATAIINDDYPLGIHRREAVLDNIDVICETVFQDSELYIFPEVLKVA